MIVEIKMYGVVCDNCKERWEDEANGFVAFTDEIGMQNVMGNDDCWHTDHATDTHYCPKCFSFDDEDNLIINKERTNNHETQSNTTTR